MPSSRVQIRDMNQCKQLHLYALFSEYISIQFTHLTCNCQVRELNVVVG